jgi:hypothetical protein
MWPEGYRVRRIGEKCRCRPAAARVWLWSWWGKLDVLRGSVRVWSACYVGLGIGTQFLKDPSPSRRVYVL